MFDKSAESFPVKAGKIFLSHCSVSPLYPGAAKAENEFSLEHSRSGVNLFLRYHTLLRRLRSAAAALLRTVPESISFMKNTAEGINIIANGYPFQPGDEVISYTHEYPSNHYPWVLQQRRGVKLILLSDQDPTGKFHFDTPRGFLLEELEQKITARTRVVALSHVQFASGFAADLTQLSRITRAHGIDLVLDAAQSLGSLPLYPEKLGISAVCASGWKWLLGPLGSGLMYTAPGFRAKLADTMAGAELMQHSEDYLNHTWNPFPDGRRFEYSTPSFSLAAALLAVLEDIFARHTVESIQKEIFRLQDIFLEGLNRRKYTPLVFPFVNRSGILSLRADKNTEELAVVLAQKNIVTTARGGCLRIAPHFYNDDREMQMVAEALNTV